MRRLRGSEGTALEQELVDTDETDDVTGRAVLDGLNVTTHHENRALHRLDEEIVLLAYDVVRALDAVLGSAAYCSGEHATEGVEATSVGGWHHLGDVKKGAGQQASPFDALDDVVWVG